LCLFLVNKGQDHHKIGNNLKTLIQFEYLKTNPSDMASLRAWNNKRFKHGAVSPFGWYLQGYFYG
jgi:hypothetical protein